MFFKKECPSQAWAEVVQAQPQLSGLASFITTFQFLCSKVAPTCDFLARANGGTLLYVSLRLLVC